MFSGIFSISTMDCSLIVFNWAYQHLILAVEVRNSAKAMLLSFNTVTVFLHDVMATENDVVEAG